MKTTLNLDDQLVQKIMKISGIKKKTDVINQALKEYLGKLVIENIKNAYGTLNFELDVREYRNRELQENINQWP